MKDLIARLRAMWGTKRQFHLLCSEAADALEAQGEQVKKWQALYESVLHVAESAQQRAGKQQAEIEALRADAERYRWLREQNIVDWDAFPWAKGYEHPDEVLDSQQMMLDAAIDAARRK